MEKKSHYFVKNPKERGFNKGIANN